MPDCIQLPLDCDVRYYPQFLSAAERDELFAYLDGIVALKDLSMRMADGSLHQLDTGRYFFVDRELTGFDALPEVWGPREPWPEFVVPIKERIEEVSGRAFDVCRVIYYADGSSSADWHVDLPAYGDTSVIASVSLGAAREFGLRRQEQPADRFSIRLAHGSLLVMGRGTQDAYEHALPKDPACQDVRFNLTFRPFDRT